MENKDSKLPPLSARRASAAMSPLELRAWTADGGMNADDALPPQTLKYLSDIEKRMQTMKPREIAARARELSLADADWRRRKCISLRAAEGIMSPGVERLLASPLATRVSEGFPGFKEGFAGGLGTDQYIEEVEAMMICLTQRMFGAKFVEWRPLSNSMANAMAYLLLAKPGDVVMAQAVVGGGANAANTPVGPGELSQLRFLRMPYLDNFEHDIEGIRRMAREVRPRFIVVGGGFILFPYPLAQLREIADEVHAQIIYDAAHVAILMAGGVFQQPLKEGVDILTLSTHKAFGGPVGGMLLTNDASIAAPILRRTLNGFIQTRDANKLVAATYGLAEVTEFGAACARQMVSNAKAFGEALDREGFKPLARKRGYTMTHHVVVDASEEGPGRIKDACRRCNLLIQGARLARDAQELSGKDSNLMSPWSVGGTGLRLSVAEVTRLGMKESEMNRIARFMRRATDGEDSRRLAAEVEEFVLCYQKMPFSFDV
jgi:glycine hydroxymethyltransferase